MYARDNHYTVKSKINPEIYNTASNYISNSELSPHASYNHSVLSRLQAVSLASEIANIITTVVCKISMISSAIATRITGISLKLINIYASNNRNSVFVKIGLTFNQLKFSLTRYGAIISGANMLKNKAKITTIRSIYIFIITAAFCKRIFAIYIVDDLEDVNIYRRDQN